MVVSKFQRLIIQVILAFRVSCQFTNSFSINNQATQQPQYLSYWEKSKTSFDGATFENQIGFLEILQGGSVTLPLSQNLVISDSTDLTMMFFFQKHLGLTNQYPLQFFSYEDSVQCIFTNSSSVSCDTPSRQKLIVTSDIIASPKWLHFTISISKDGNSFIQIRDRGGDVQAEDSTSSLFNFKTKSNLAVCFGNCNIKYQNQPQGFAGNIREVYMSNSFTSKNSIGVNATHQIRIYSSDVLGYYRFTQANGLNERFTNKKAIVSQANLTSIQDPVDVCPFTYEIQSFPLLKPDCAISPISLKSQLLMKNYAFTVSLTMKLNRNTCWASDYQTAENRCSLVHLDQVFMMYLQQPNQMRVHFYAEKSYYKTQSTLFFVPFNEWITVQLTISHLGGYQLLILDQESKILSQASRNANMQAHLASKSLKIFTGSTGKISQFILIDKAYNLPISTNQSDTLFNVDFRNINSKLVPNLGRDSRLQLSSTPSTIVTPYKASQFGQRVQTSPAFFDGVTCNDRHATAKLISNNSSLTFFANYSISSTTKPVHVQEATIQFWFKFSNASEYKSNSSNIFKMLTPDKIGNFWEIQMINGVLVVDPFGDNEFEGQTISEVLEFREFQKQNEDSFGWWHLSCSYSLSDRIFECILFNSVIEIKRSTEFKINTIDRKTFYQTNYTCVFGKTDITHPIKFFSSQVSGVSGLYIKEIVYLARKANYNEVGKSRYQQAFWESQDYIAYTPLTQNIIVNENDLKFIEIEFEPEFIFKDVTIFQNGIIEQIKKQLYHTVCPINTYHRDDGFCYNNPVDQIVLAIFPFFNQTEQKLSWIFTLDHSVVIKKSVINELVGGWDFGDRIIQNIFLRKNQYLLDKKQNLLYPLKTQTNRLNITVSSQHLRNEDTYQISAAIRNVRDPTTYYDFQQITFIPNYCQWFEIEGYNSYSGRIEVKDLPGTSDISFRLNQISNPVIDCIESAFYSQFDSIEFNFILDSDQGEYISVQPLVKVIVNPNQIEQGILITLTQDQQHKLPVWQDIKILMKIKWVSKFDPNITKNVIFQNAMITIHIAPTNYSSLKVELSRQTMKSTLILSANESKLEGVDSQFIYRYLQYNWDCPEDFTIQCQNQKDKPTMYLKYDKFVTLKKDYTFNVYVIFKSPNSVSQSQNSSTNVIWISQNNISFVPLNANASFDSKTPQFNQTINQTNSTDSTPPVVHTNKTIENNTQPELSSNQTEYNTKQELSNNQTQMNSFPPELSSNQTEINSFQPELSSDQTEINSFQPELSSNLTEMNSTEQELSSNQTEMKSFPPELSSNQTEINSFQPELSSDQTAINSFQPELSSNQTEMNSTEQELSSNQTEMKSFQPELSSNQTEMNSFQPELSSNLTEMNSFQPELSRDQTEINSTQQELSSNQSEMNYTQPELSSNQISIEKNDTDSEKQQFNNSTSMTIDIRNNSQINQNYIQQNETQSDQSSNSTNTFEDSLTNLTSLSSEENILPPRTLQAHNTTQIQATIQFILQTISPIPDLKSEIEQAFYSSNETERGIFAQQAYDIFIKKVENPLDAIFLLDNLNQYARLNNESLSNDVLERLLDLPLDINYRSGELQISSQIFNHKNAGDLKILQALDTSYVIDSNDLINQMPNMPQQDFIMQSIAMKALNDTTWVYLRIQDSLTKNVLNIGQLDGGAKISFQTEQYIPNQTTCFAKRKEGWISDVCLTQLDAKQKVVDCTCNMIEATIITLRNDYTKIAGELVVFHPAISANSTTLIEYMQGTSYFFVAVVCVISFNGIFSTVYVWNLDRKSWDQINKTLDGWKLDLIKTVAQKQGQSLELVKLRQFYILSSYITRNSVIFYILVAVHPLFEPFFSFNPVQTRVIRFHTYYLQLNFFVIACMLYFGPTYRKNDQYRQDYVLEAVDVKSISTGIALGGIFLLPIISRPLQCILSNKLLVTPTKVEVVRRRILLKTIFIIQCLTLNFATVICAVYVCRTSPTSNQYLIAATVFGGFCFSSAFTNMIVVIFNYFAAKKMAKLTYESSRQILLDIQCVVELSTFSSKIKAARILQKNEDVQIQIETELPFQQEELQVETKYLSVNEQAPPSSRKD